MAFFAPAAFGLVLLLPVIIAMYLLKLRRTEQEVASIYLWQRMLQDIEANAPWQKLKANILLILQLLIAVALILALARPFTWGEGAAGEFFILVMDSSASMQAMDGSPTRFETARQEAQHLIQGLPSSARVTIIEAGERAELRLAGSLDRAAANRALNEMSAGNGQADLVTALELASAAAAGRDDADIVVITDGGTNLDSLSARFGQVRFLFLGQSDDNQAIELFSVESQPGGDYTAFVRVVNYSSQAVTRRLTLTVGGVLVNAFDLELDAGGSQSIVAEGLAAELVEANLVGEDALPLDDRAWAVPGGGQMVQVALVTSGNLFLEAALALLPGIEFARIDPEEYAPAEEGEQRADLTVFDGFIPGEFPPGAMLFVGPAASTSFFEVGPNIEGVRPRVVEPEHAVVRFVDMSQVEILDAPVLELSPLGRVLVTGEVEGESAPLIAVFEGGQSRAAVLAFDLRRSDLPLQTAFPILMANLIAWLSPGVSGGLPDQVQVGEIVTYIPPAEAERVTLIRPDGSRAGLDIVDGVVRIEDNDMLGLYRLETDGGQIDHYVVNLFQSDESNIRPRVLEEVPLGETGTAPGETQLSRLEWWPWFAGAALLTLMIEWMVYQRAAIARLASWLRARRAHD